MHSRFYPNAPRGTVVAGICALLAVAAIGAARAQDAAPAPSPAPDAALVEQGRYLATAGDCVSCHTRPGGQPFAGGLPLKTQFGTLYTPNITPDRDTGIGGWSEEQLARAMREGVADDGDHLYPVFPYTAYTKVTDEDVHAIFAYLRSLQPVIYTPPKNEMKFPFSIRPLMIVWNKLFFKEGRFVPDASKPAEWNRGAYLVEGLGHCGSCHTPRNVLGGERASLALTGGTYLDEITDAVEDQNIVALDNLVRPWSAVSLTTSPTGLGAWSVGDIEAYLKTGHNKRAGVFGPMSKVVNNSTKFLSDPDLHAIAVYLTSLPAATRNSGQKIPDDKIKAGEIVYTTRCGDCHLPTGLGIAQGPNVDPTKVSPPLVGNAVVQAPDPATLINVILYGAHEGTQGADSWPKMPGFENEVGIDDDQIAALANYLRASWGNQGDAVAPSAVAKQR